MGVNKDMDLFETVRDKLGCEYISDMRSCRALLADAKKVVASLDLEAYTARELADMAVSVKSNSVQKTPALRILSEPE